MNVEPAIDLVLNVFERTYRQALTTSVVQQIEQDNATRFARRVVLINNVKDPADARERAQKLLTEGSIDRFCFVAEHRARALNEVGLTGDDLEPLLHYSDAPLVGASLEGSPWMLYWDPQARLDRQVDWVGPTIELMENDPSIMVANPSWEAPNIDGIRRTVEAEAIRLEGEFAIGHGFSDQIFLARRADLLRPIYHQRCVASLMFPAAHKARTFEARLDAHMRHHGRTRATALMATYLTDSGQGESDYSPVGLLEALRFGRNTLILRAFRYAPWRPRCLRHSWL